jgi:hypothetical protein
VIKWGESTHFPGRTGNWGETTRYQYNQRPSRTSNSKQIKVLSATTEIYKHSFFQRTVKDWNTLTESAVSSKTVEGFKAAISRDLQEPGSALTHSWITFAQ